MTIRNKIYKNIMLLVLFLSIACANTGGGNDDDPEKNNNPKVQADLDKYIQEAIKTKDTRKLYFELNKLPNDKWEGVIM